MGAANDQSFFVSALARLLPELRGLEDAGFVQALSEPKLTYRHKIALGAWGNEGLSHSHAWPLARRN